MRSMTRRDFVGTALATAAVLAGCSSDGSEQIEETATQDVQEDDQQQPADVDVQQDASPDDDSPFEKAPDGVLVAYFSRADENYADGGTEWLEVGHTKVMASYIIEELGADEYEIVPKEAYPKGYDDCCDQAKREQSDDARPAIAGDLPDLSTYGTVFIGCPIWWGEDPMIIRTFVEGLDFTGKVIAPFTTHGGSGLGLVLSTLQSLQPNAYFREGKAVAGTAVDGARDEVVAWAHKVLG